VVGLRHNIDAWRYNSELTGRFLADLKRISPPANSTLCVDNWPEHIDAIQFFDVNPTAAAHYALRIPVTLDRTSADCLSKPNVIHLRYDTPSGTLQPASTNK